MNSANETDSDLVRTLLWSVCSKLSAKHREKIHIFKTLKDMVQSNCCAIADKELDDTNFICADQLNELFERCYYNYAYFTNYYLQTERYCNEFEEIELLGCGGFGSVYKARSKFNDNLYAIKKIPVTDSEQCENTIKELKIWANLSTKYVVQYNNAWIELNESKYNYRDQTKECLRINSIEKELKAIVFIQMELCGLTLKQIIGNLNIELNQSNIEVNFRSLSPVGYYIACELFLEIVECVHYLHSRDPPVIHRDLKPTNILITDGSNGRFVKIADFGLATNHLFDEQSHSIALGTQQYMAPEVRNSRKYNTKADMYSLGIILKELINIDNDDTSVYKSGPKSVLFKSHYICACILYHNLVSSAASVRSTCEHILKNRHLLSLSIHELLKTENLEQYTVSDYDDKFCAKFLRQRLQTHYANKPINSVLYPKLTNFSGFKKQEKLDISDYLINMIETALHENLSDRQNEFSGSKIDEVFTDDDNDTYVALFIDKGYKVHGLTNFTINKFNALFDLEKIKLELNGKITFADIKINGNYMLNGKVYRYFPVKGNGLISIELQDLTASFVIIASVRQNRIVTDLVDVKISFSKIDLHFENLFDAKMSPFLNYLINLLAKPLSDRILTDRKKMAIFNREIQTHIERKLNKNKIPIQRWLKAMKST